MTHPKTESRKSPSSHSPLSRAQAVFFAVLLLICVGVVFAMVLPYLLALMIGGFLALLSYPLFRILRRRHIRPMIASAIITVGIILLVIIPVTIFISVAIQQGTEIANAISNDADFSFQALLKWLSGLDLIQTFFGSQAAVESQIRSWSQSLAKMATLGILAIVTDIPQIILQVAIVCMSCFFFLADGATFISWMNCRIPLEPHLRSKLSRLIKTSVDSVFLSTIAAASVQSAIILVSFLILSVPASIFAAGATFILAWIPLIGSTPVWVGATIYLYASGFVLKAALMLGFGVITGLSDNFVRPAVLKGRQNLHPLVSLVAIFGGIAMFGLMGVFIGPVLAALVISLLQVWPSIGERFGLIAGTDRAKIRKADQL